MTKALNWPRRRSHNVDADFYSVAIPEPTTILGVRLLPLSVGHLVILHRLRSCFVTPDEPFSPHDLALSVLVCSTKYKEGLKLFSNPKRWLFNLWFWKLSRPSLLQKLHLKKPTAIDFAEKCKAFNEYLGRHCESPHYEYDPSCATRVSASEVQIVRVSIMQALGISDDAIMDRSWLLCLWDHVTLKAISGQLTLSDRSKVRAAQEWAERMTEKERRSNGAA